MYGAGQVMSLILSQSLNLVAAVPVCLTVRAVQCSTVMQWCSGAVACNGGVAEQLPESNFVDHQIIAPSTHSLTQSLTSCRPDVLIRA
jgi:hypothetical protein